MLKSTGLSRSARCCKGSAVHAFGVEGFKLLLRLFLLTDAIRQLLLKVVLYKEEAKWPSSIAPPQQFSKVYLKLFKNNLASYRAPNAPLVPGLWKFVKLQRKKCSKDMLTTSISVSNEHTFFKEQISGDIATKK